MKGKTPRCEENCSNTEHKIPYKEDKRYGKVVYAIRRNEGQVRQEIYKSGPVETCFELFEDFFAYRSGKNREFDIYNL